MWHLRLDFIKPRFKADKLWNRGEAVVFWQKTFVYSNKKLFHMTAFAHCSTSSLRKSSWMCVCTQSAEKTSSFNPCLRIHPRVPKVQERWRFLSLRWHVWVFQQGLCEWILFWKVHRNTAIWTLSSWCVKSCKSVTWCHVSLNFKCFIFIYYICLPWEKLSSDKGNTAQRNKQRGIKRQR